MNPQEVTAWIQVAQILASIGLSVGEKLKGLIAHAHPTLTAEEQNAAYDAIMADDDVRGAMARAAAGG